MAMADSAHGAAESYSVSTQARRDGLRALRPKPLILAAIVLALALAGCARNPPPRESSLTQRQVRTTPVRLASHARVHSETQRHAELHVHRPDPALLAPQPTPNCEFKRADIKAVDPDEWIRLKTEYERQCYQDAEKAARERLSQLQGAAACEIEHAPQTAARAQRHAHSRPRS
jgi:outer membrane murein-binding lipoprotein Lpp